MSRRVEDSPKSDQSDQHDRRDQRIVGTEAVEAFVVWIDAQSETTGLHGVVERMDDSQRSAFDSIDDLVELLQSRAQRGPST